MEPINLDPDSADSHDDAEYKRVKRTMAVMVNFYRNGATKKKDQLDAAKAELEKLDGTLCMAKIQLKALQGVSGSVPPAIYKFAAEPPTTAPVPKKKKKP